MFEKLNYFKDKDSNNNSYFYTTPPHKEQLKRQQIFLVLILFIDTYCNARRNHLKFKQLVAILGYLTLLMKRCDMVVFFFKFNLILCSFCDIILQTCIIYGLFDILIDTKEHQGSIKSKGTERKKKKEKKNRAKRTTKTARKHYTRRHDTTSFL